MTSLRSRPAQSSGNRLRWTSVIIIATQDHEFCSREEKDWPNFHHAPKLSTDALGKTKEDAWNMKLIRWILALAILSIWAALIGTALFVAMYEPSSDVPEGSAIVALAGNAEPSGGIEGETEARIRRAVELFKDGAAPVLVVTGGTDGESPPVATAMRDYAVEAGVPENAILVEDASHSTLQNALFTADLEGLDLSQPIIIVTHRYHLPRANASFRWAGFEVVIGEAADNVAGFAFSEGLLWESLKWPWNALRAAAASAAMAGNVPRENYMKYLE